jgi:hypothetical protein
MLLVQSRPSRLGILNGIPPLTPPLGFANSMTLPSICPHCRSERVAADEIGCPQCGFVFEPEDGLELELIDDPELESIERLQDHAEVEGEPSLSTQEMLSTQEISWAAIGAATARPKRAESSVLRKILPPILGGLCAVPIATAIMWYGFGRDLGTLGPTVAEFVPEIVPKHLRGSAGRAARQSNGRLPQLQRDHSSESNNLSRDRNSSANGEDNDIVESSVPPPLPPSLVSKDPPKREKADEKDESTLLAAESSSPSLIPSLLKSIRARQEALYESPKEKKPVLIAEFYRETVLLSQHSLNLQGRSGEAWKEEIAKLGRELLADSSCKKVLSYGPDGKLPDVPATRADDFLATWIELKEGIEMSKGKSTRSFSVSHLPQVSEFVLAQEACRGSSVRGPTTFFVLGKLGRSVSDPSKLVLEIHAISHE